MKYASQSNWENFQKLHNKVNIEMRNVRFNGKCFKFNDLVKTGLLSSRYWGEITNWTM